MTVKNFRIIYIFIVFIFGVGIAFLSTLDNYLEKIDTQKKHQKPTPMYEFLNFRDTVYVLGNEYISISLKSQRATLHRRHDTSITYKISSGNDRIVDGISTNVGLFTVQSKSPLAVSKQFDDAELYNWIGFHGNIGFHGLKGRGYYYTLGLRPSSHGCVRISREDGEKLYKLVKLGTPILVYDDEPARVLAFSNDSIIHEKNAYLFIRKSIEQRRMMNRRIENMYGGNANISNRTKIYMDGRTILRPGAYDIGIAKKLPLRQNVYDYFIKSDFAANDNVYTYLFIPDPKTLKKLKYEVEDSTNYSKD